MAKKFYLATFLVMLLVSLVSFVTAVYSVTKHDKEVAVFLVMIGLIWIWISDKLYSKYKGASQG